MTAHITEILNETTILVYTIEMGIDFREAEMNRYRVCVRYRNNSGWNQTYTTQFDTIISHTHAVMIVVGGAIFHKNCLYPHNHSALALARLSFAGT